MIEAVSGEITRQRRSPEVSRTGSGMRFWRTNFIGSHGKKLIEDRPQAYLIEMEANGVIAPHFHQIDQFQVLVAGSGSMGRNPAPVIALHYVDHHTAYGPINAGSCGLSLMTIRARTDSGATFLSNPRYKDFLKPTKKRYLLAEGIALSTEPVLQIRTAVSLENLFAETEENDGLGAFMLRLGASMRTTGPDPKVTGGQYYLVVNGSLQFEGASYPPWSTVYAGPADAPLEVCAGPRGLEAIVLNFPRAQA